MAAISRQPARRDPRTAGLVPISTVLLVLAAVSPACTEDGSKGPCPATHRSEGGDCEPIFDDCPGPTAIPVLGGGCLNVGVTQCATGFVADGVGGCAATLPGNDCPPGSMAKIGNSACQPVGITQCAAGFVVDGEGGCAPILPPGPEPCPPGSMEILGQTACQPIGDCGNGSWGNLIDDGLTIHVDQSYDGIPASDGSRQAPYLTVAEAVAAAVDGGQIAIAAGDYAERVIIDRPLRVRGRCAALTTLRGRRILQTDYPPLWVTSNGGGSTIAGLTLTGDAEGLTIFGAADLRVEDVEVRDTGDVGVLVMDGAEASLTRVVVAGAAGMGIWSLQSQLALEEVVLRDTLPKGNLAGLGATAQCSTSTGICGHLSVHRSLIDHNRDVGIVSHGVDVDITESVLRDTQEHPGNGGSGKGVEATCHANTGDCGLLRMTQTVVSNTRQLGIALDGPDGELTEVTVTDTLAPQSGWAIGWGIGVQCNQVTQRCGSLSLLRSAISGSRDAAVFVSGGSADIRGSIVRDTVSAEAGGQFGEGIIAQCDQANGRCGSLTLGDSLVTRNQDAGIVALGIDTTILSSVISDTEARTVDGTRGVGIAAKCDVTGGSCGSLTVRGALVTGNRVVGILCDGVDCGIHESVVSDTRVRSADGLFGRGIEAHCDRTVRSCPSLELRGSLITRNRDLGLYLAGTDATIINTTISDTLSDESRKISGRGIAAQCDAELLSCGQLTLTSSLIARNQQIGIYLSGLPTRLDSVIVVDTGPVAAGDWVGRGGNAVLATCDPDLDRCDLLELQHCLLRSSHTAALTSQGVSGQLLSSIIDTVAPRQVDDAYGYGIEVVGQPGAELPVWDVHASAIVGASLASILYFRSTGTVSDSDVTGADFAVVWSSSPQKPTIGSGNRLKGNHADSLSQQDLEPAPAPNPAMPITDE